MSTDIDIDIDVGTDIVTDINLDMVIGNIPIFAMVGGLEGIAGFCPSGVLLHELPPPLSLLPSLPSQLAPSPAPPLPPRRRVPVFTSNNSTNSDKSHSKAAYKESKKQKPA